jgi:hypothetical protein
MPKNEKSENQELEPFLFRFLERDQRPTEMVGMMSGGKEDEPTPEPTKKTPWGD